MVATDRQVLDSVFAFFGELPSKGQVRLFDSVTVHDLAPGDVLFWQGQTGGSVYFVETGELSIWWEAADGEQELMRFAGRGDSVTPAALLDETPRIRSCLAEAPTRVLELSASGFRQLTALDPKTAGHVLDMLSTCAAEHPDSGDPAQQLSWLDALPSPD